MIENINIVISKEPVGDYKKAEQEIYESLVRNKCTIGTLKYIVDNIVEKFVNQNPLK